MLNSMHNHILQRLAEDAGQHSEDPSQAGRHLRRRREIDNITFNLVRHLTAPRKDKFESMGLAQLGRAAPGGYKMAAQLRADAT